MWSLLLACGREWEAFSRSGPIVIALAIPIMYSPVKRKLVVAEQLGGRALRADEEVCSRCSPVLLKGDDHGPDHSKPGT
jgi:hypothetical protein